MRQPTISAPIAATGTTPYAATLVDPMCAKRSHRDYSGQPALLNRRSRETTAVIPVELDTSVRPLQRCIEYYSYLWWHLSEIIDSHFPLHGLDLPRKIDLDLDLPRKIDLRRSSKEDRSGSSESRSCTSDLAHVAG